MDASFFRSFFSRKAALALFIFVAIVYAASFGIYHTTNDYSRFILSKALCQGKLSVETVAVTCWDLSAHAGKIYSRYPPLPSILAAPFYFAGALAFNSGWLPPIARTEWAVKMGGWFYGYAGSFDDTDLWGFIFSNAAPVLLASAVAAMVFLVCRRWYGAKAAIVCAAAVAFGSPLWVYSHSMFDVAFSTFFVFLSYYFLLKNSRLEPSFELKVGPNEIVLSGLSLGLAVCTRSDALLIALPLLVLVLSELKLPGNLRNLRLHQFSGVGYFLFGLIPPVLALAAYNSFAFGGPLANGYNFSCFSNNPKGELAVMNEAATLVDFSQLMEKATDLLVAPQRGLFWASPFLLASLAGAITLLKKSKRLVLSLFLPLLLLLAFELTRPAYTILNSGHFGARYLVCAIPMLALVAGEAYKDKVERIALLALAAISVVLCAQGVAYLPPGPTLPPEFNALALRLLFGST